jgi:gamma-glutamylcyclotransferase (GGCT)/AIG2-like uncharacterized protein YtfP
MADSVLYFAYGSNLDPDRARERGLDVGTARRASLADYRFAFNKRAKGGGVYANVMSSPYQTAWGVVFRSNEAQLKALDKFEGVPRHYNRTSVRVTLDDGSTVEAIAYVACKEYLVREGRPSERYLGYILSGARFHRLPATYIEKIERLAAGCETSGPECVE